MRTNLTPQTVQMQMDYLAINLNLGTIHDSRANRAPLSIQWLIMVTGAYEFDPREWLEFSLTTIIYLELVKG